MVMKMVIIKVMLMIIVMVMAMVIETLLIRELPISQRRNSSVTPISQFCRKR